MRGEILSVGTELLLGQITNTNARYLAERLAAAGVFVYHQVTVGDNPERLRAVYAVALQRADVVIATGGLGPTYDDLTKEVLADVLGVQLVQDEEALATLRGWFAAKGVAFGAIQEKQTMKPDGAELLPNPRGTAPGVLWQRGGQLVALLPGPPNEMRAIFEASVFPRLRGASGEHLVSRRLRIAGIGEAAIQERLSDLMAAENPTVAPYAKLAEVELRISARAPSDAAAEALLGPVALEVRRRLGYHVYGEGDEQLHDACGKALGAAGLTVATAESVTGGLVAERLTRVPGASAYMRGAAVVYALEEKERQLGIDPQRIGDGVSAELALEMARAVKERFSAQVGIATCGFAGPDGRQVGLSYIAVAGALGEKVRELRAHGDRQEIRERIAQAALSLLWERLQRKE
ncbi:MAG: competence/damage-inducible protein A [Thermaerobacter sp.]|nr:competence/damage-inducible protein A [Thermaerobacter sp.]